MLRRVIGAMLMALGGLAAVGVAIVAGVVILNFVEWENAADALGTLAMILGTPLAGGLAVFALGRWVYGRRIIPARPARPA